VQGGAGGVWRGSGPAQHQVRAINANYLGQWALILGGGRGDSCWGCSGIEVNLGLREVLEESGVAVGLHSIRWVVSSKP
jgi:hypothetical protein